VRDREPGVHGQRHDARRRRATAAATGVKRYPAHRPLAARLSRWNVITVFDEGRHAPAVARSNSSVETNGRAMMRSFHGSGGLEAGFDEGGPEIDALWLGHARFARSHLERAAGAR